MLTFLSSVLSYQFGHLPSYETPFFQMVDVILSKFPFSRKIVETWNWYQLERLKGLGVFILIHHSKIYLPSECTGVRPGICRDLNFFSSVFVYYTWSNFLDSSKHYNNSFLQNNRTQLYSFLSLCFSCSNSSAAWPFLLIPSPLGQDVWNLMSNEHQGHHHSQRHTPKPSPFCRSCFLLSVMFQTI